MTKITTDGVYNIPSAAYHADNFLPEPSLSSSIAKLLVTPGGTPLHAWNDCPRLNPDHEPEESNKFDLGKAAHALMLGDPQTFAIVDADAWTTKAAKETRESARRAGKIPILVHHYDEVIAMVGAGRKQLAAHEEGREFFDNGKPEQTLVWREGEIWCRARIDWLPDSGVLYPDYKSTAASADPDLWPRTMYGMGADIQAAFYCRGIRAVGLCERPGFRFAVQENYAPYLLSVIGLMPGAMDLADRKVERAIQLWSYCRRANLWPGYPARTCFIDAPAWHEAQVLDREQRQHDASQAALARGADAQRPL